MPVTEESLCSCATEKTQSSKGVRTCPIASAISGLGAPHLAEAKQETKREGPGDPATVYPWRERPKRKPSFGATSYVHSEAR